MDKSSILNFVFKAGVLLIALGIFASYIKHTQREADAMRAELTEVKNLLLQQNSRTALKAENTIPILTGVRLSESPSLQPNPQNKTERPKLLSDTSAAIAELVAKTPSRHLMAGSKSSAVFPSSWIKIAPTSDELNLTSVEADTINSMVTPTAFLRRKSKYAMIGSSKSLVLEPSYPVSALSWLFDLKPQKTSTASEDQGSFLMWKKSGLTEQDLDKLWKPEQPPLSIPTAQP